MNRGVLYLVSTAVIWGWPTVFIKFLSSDFDVVTQSFFRYLAASVFLLIWAYFFARSDFRKALKRPKNFIIPGILVVAFQCTYVLGIYYTSAVVANLIHKTTVFFTLGLSFLFLYDEKRIMKSTSFLVGIILGTLGVLGVVMGGSPLQEVSALKYNEGAMLLLLCSFIWAIYTVLIKKIIGDLQPPVATGFVLSFSSLFFIPLVLLFGDMTVISRLPLSTNLILFGSGILCVGIGNVFYYLSVHMLGTSKTTTCLLLTPLFGAIFAYMVLGEVLTPFQLISGALLLAGSFLIVNKELKPLSKKFKGLKQGYLQGSA